MSGREANEIKAVELRYRGLALADSLREAAEALAREIGGEQPARRRKDSTQFPFAAALAQRMRTMDTRYGGVLEAAPDALIVADAMGGVVLVNAEAEARLGYGREELLGLRLSAVLEGAPLEPPGPGEPLAWAKKPPAGGVELRAIRKDGVHYPVEATVGATENAEGPLVIVSFRDVSARKAAERRLGRLEARARTLLEQAPDPMLVVNKRGSILLFNARAEAVFGYAGEEVLGQPATLLVPEGLAGRLVADDGGPAYRAVAESAGTPATVVVRHKDGTHIEAEMTLGALKSSDGVLFVAAFRDLGGRSAPGQPAAQNLPLAMLRSAPDALLAIDRRGDIVFFNDRAEHRFGYARDEVLGLPVTRLFPEGFAERFVGDPLGQAEASLALEIGTGIALLALTGDGASFDAELMLSPLETPDGVLTLVSVRDGTLRRTFEAVPEAPVPEAEVGRLAALERRLRDLGRSREELSQYAEIVANQLREPLRHLAETAGKLRAALPEPREARALGLLGAMTTEASRMETLITDLLAFSRVGKEPLQLARAKAETLLLRATEGLTREIAESGAIVSHETLPEIECDAGEIVVLFRHLVANAIAYRGSEPPRIRVSATPNAAGEWVFAVADNGIGIERQYFERVFQMFQRLHRHAAVPGTGIGLALCRRIAERHGGRIWVDSRPGLGSTFHVVLPARKPA